MRVAQHAHDAARGQRRGIVGGVIELRDFAGGQIEPLDAGAHRAQPDAVVIVGHDGHYVVVVQCERPLRPATITLDCAVEWVD